jgi:hypothetical protein
MVKARTDRRRRAFTLWTRGLAAPGVIAPIQAADRCVRFLGDWINDSTQCLSVW